MTPEPPTLLYVGWDDGNMRTRKLVLESVGFRLLICPTLPKALSELSNVAIGVVMLESELQTYSEIAVQIKSSRPDIQILLLASPWVYPAPSAVLDGRFEKGDGPERMIAEVTRLLLRARRTLSNGSERTHLPNGTLPEAAFD
jgi:hypothetical protein